MASKFFVDYVVYRDKSQNHSHSTCVAWGLGGFPEIHSMAMLAAQKMDFETHKFHKRSVLLNPAEEISNLVWDVLHAAVVVY